MCFNPLKPNSSNYYTLPVSSSSPTTTPFHFALTYTECVFSLFKQQEINNSHTIRMTHIIFPRPSTKFPDQINSLTLHDFQVSGNPASSPSHVINHPITAFNRPRTAVYAEEQCCLITIS